MVVDVGVGFGVGVGAVTLDVFGCVICPTASDFSDAEIERNSSETLFKVTVISSGVNQSSFEPKDAPWILAMQSLPEVNTASRC